MSIDTAKQVVDRIFESPNRSITIEFQGGEPLLNFRVVKFITEYAYKRNEKEKRRLLISLVSNLASMDKVKFKYILDNKISICTSLDGHERLHNKNRILAGRKNSYKEAKKWFIKFRESFKNGDYPHFSLIWFFSL